MRALTARLSLALIAVVFLSGCMVESVAERRAAELRNEALKALPESATRTQVERYLDEEGLLHSYTEEEATIYAMKRGVWAGLVVEASIQLQFRFDEQGQLRTIETEIIYTGP